MSEEGPRPATRSRRRPVVLVGVGLGATVLACGAVQATTGILRASTELDEARTAGAARHAPFELTASQIYLEQARREEARAEVEPAMRYAEKAWACARVALRLAAARASDPPLLVRPEDFAREAVCRPGPKRDVPLAHLEPAARETRGSRRAPSLGALTPADASPPVPGPRPGLGIEGPGPADASPPVSGPRPGLGVEVRPLDAPAPVASEGASATSTSAGPRRKTPVAGPSAIPRPEREREEPASEAEPPSAARPTLKAPHEGEPRP